MPRANSQSRLRTACIISSACLGALATVSPSRGNTTANWLAPVSGNWTDATKWSTDPQYPHTIYNSGTVTDYDAEISASGSPYVVTSSGSDIQLNSVTLNSGDATLSLDGNYFHPTSGLTINSGTLLVNGGELSQTTVDGTGGQIILRSGEIYSTTLKRDATVTAPQAGQSSSTIYDLTLDNSTLTLSPGAAIGAMGDLSGGSIVAQDGASLHAIAGDGVSLNCSNVTLNTDVFVEGDDVVFFNDGAILTPGRRVVMVGKGSGVQVSPGFAGEILFENNSSDGSRAASNFGTNTIGPGVVMRTAGGNGWIGDNYPATFTTNNAGLISVETDGNWFDIGDSEQAFNNTGTLRVSAGALNSSANLTNTGTIDVLGGTCDLGGVWNSSNGTINLSGGQINLGGTGFDLSDIGTFNRTGGNVYLTGTFNNTNGTTADLTNKVGTWLIAKGAQINGGTIVSPDNNGGVIYVPFGESLTIDSAAIDAGVVVAGSATLSLLGNWSASKSIYLQPGSTAVLGGNLTAANMNALRYPSGTTIRITGAMDNSGATINASNGTNWQLAGGTISGGKIVSTNGASLEVLFSSYTSYSTLDGVTLAGSLLLDQGAKVKITNGLTGVGSFVFTNALPPPASPTTSAPSPAWAFGLASISAGDAPLTIGSSIAVVTGSGSGSIGYAGTTLTNYGLISAHTFGQTISIAGAVNNLGTIEMGSGGTINTSTEVFSSSGVVRVDAGSTFTIQGPLTVTGGSIGGNGDIRALKGASISGRVAKTDSGVLDIVNGLMMSPGARLDMISGGAIVRHPSAQLGTWNGATYTDLTGLIQSGRNGGTWDGPGIMTSYSNGGDHNEIGIASAAQALGISATQTGTWMGQFVNGSDVLVMYTYGGDANLDGKINIDDYGRIDASVGRSGSVFGWYNGDFNYDGKINIDDYGIIDSNIGSQGPPLGIASDQALAGIAQADGITAVPEPSAILLLMLPLLALPARRTRRSPNDLPCRLSTLPK